MIIENGTVIFNDFAGREVVLIEFKKNRVRVLNISASIDSGDEYWVNVGDLTPVKFYYKD